MSDLRTQIKRRLESLPYIRLIVNDDSGQHVGHVGNPDGKGQTHFSIEIVSPAFEGVNRVARQRMVLDMVEPLWSDTTLHALSIRALTPAEDTGKTVA